MSALKKLKEKMRDVRKIAQKINKFQRSIKALSPIISVLLLIAIAVVASLVVYAWVMGYIGGATTKAGLGISIQSLASNSTSGDLTIYVQNTGMGAVQLNPASAVYINDTLTPILSPTGDPYVTIAQGQTLGLVVDWPYSGPVTIKVVTTTGAFMQTTGTATSGATTYTVSFSTNGGGGGSTISPSAGTYSYPAGPVAISATAGTGYSFTGWTYNGLVSIVDTNSNPTSATVSGAGTITANFAQTNEAITVTQSNDGTISPGTTNVPYGTSQDFSVTPDAGYLISSITVDGSPVTVSSSSGQTVSFTDVTATHTLTATFTPAQVLTSITISPGTASITAGGSQAYTVTALDQNGNSMGDVTSSSALAASTGATATGSSVSSDTTGSYSVTATYEGLTSNTATLTVTPAAVTTLTISPSTGSITAGASQAFNATATDTYGNQWNANASATFAAPGASVTGNSVSSIIAGTYSVTATYGGVTSNTANLTVTPGAAVSLTISPSTASITAGGTQAYTATAVDADGNQWNVNASAAFAAPTGATVTANSVSSTLVGSYSITATYGGVTSNTANLTVTPGAAVSLTISPSTASITAGGTQAYTAMAADTYGNTWAATNSVTWSINLAAGGSWSGATYTSAIASGSSPWTVTATLGSINSNNAQLTVTAGPLAQFTVTAQGGGSIPTEHVGTPFYITINATDNYGNLVTTYAGPNTLSLVNYPSGTLGTITPTSTSTDGAFVAGSWTGQVTASAGTVYISTSGGGFSGQSLNFVVDAATGSGDVLVFVPDTSQTLAAGTRSTVITVERETSSGTPITTGTTQVNLASTSTSYGFYAGSTGGSTITYIDITTGSTATFYYQDTVAGNPILSVTATGYTGASISFTINPGTLGSFAITGPGGSEEYDGTYMLAAATVGQPFTMTITAEDQYGNTVTTFAGTVTLSDTSGTLTPTSITGFVNGAYTVTTATILKVYAGGGFFGFGGSYDTITATSSGKTGTAEIAVNPGAIGKFVIGSIGSQVANDPFSITITAEDSYGNVITNFDASTVISDSSGTVTPTSTGSYNWYNGVWTGDVTVTKAGSDTITVTDGSVSDSSGPFTVAAYGTLSTFVVSVTSGSYAAGTGQISVTITAEDAYGNVVANAGSATLTETNQRGNSNGGTVNPSTVAFTNGQWSGTVTLTKAGTVYITATSGSVSGTSSNSVTITAGAATQLVFTVAPASVQHSTSSSGSGLHVSTVFTVQLEDQYGNPVSGATISLSSSSGTGTFYSSSSGSSGSIITSVTTNSNGLANFYYSDTTSSGAGTYTITASYSASLKATTSIKVT